MVTPPPLILTLIEQALSLQVTYAKRGAQLRFVGGCVRDAVLGIKSQDIDLATPLPPDQGMKLLKQEGIHCIPTGIKHGTFTAILNHQPYEITTLRQDLTTDGRHAQIAFSNDWQIDAARRDLTINALYADFEGKIYDYFDGITDLNQGVIRFIGDAQTRIQEDYLRLLRLFRFHAWFGKYPLDQGTLAVCYQLADKLLLLSKERLTKEMLRLLEAPNPYPTLVQMAASKVLSSLFEGNTLHRLAVLMDLEKRFNFFPNPLRRLCVLNNQDNLFRFSKAQETYLFHQAELQQKNLFDPAQYRYLLSIDDKELVRDALILKYSQGVFQTADVLSHTLKMIDQIHLLPFPLTGNDLLSMGMLSGPKIGEMLEKCRRWWAENNGSPSRQACLDWVKQQLD